MNNTKHVAASVVTLVLLSIPGGAEQPSVRAALQVPQERRSAPAFRLQNAEGKSTPLSNFRGRIVLLNFWATECGGCKAELPYFMEFDRAYGSKGLRTLGISMEEGWARVRPFVKQRGIEYPILMADAAMSKAYAIEVMPATYLIDKKGRIAARYIGIVDKADVEKNLKALLAER
jgi:peroxiredoxin